MTPAFLELSGIRKEFGSFVALRRASTWASPRASSSASRALGLRQDDAAAHHRRA